MKFDETNVFGFKDAIIGARNPMMSHDKMDSTFDDNNISIGQNDLSLLQKLLSTNDDSDSKFMRYIHAQVQITAPAYWLQELHTYKVGTAANSSSLQHKGASRDFTIRDFEVEDERIYDVLDPVVHDYRSENPIEYKYETNEYKLLTLDNGRQYKVYKNGRIVSCKFEYTDTYGRHRTFEEKEVSPYQSKTGYWSVRIGGRSSYHYTLHDLVAELWCDKPDSDIRLEVNHKDYNRGNNCAGNLEWVTHQENEAHKHKRYNESLSTRYKKYKNGLAIDPIIRAKIKEEYAESDSALKIIADKYNVPMSTASQIVYCGSEYCDLFYQCWVWEKLIDDLNQLRRLYKDTNDYEYFREMRQLIPMSYQYTIMWDASYATLRNIYRQRILHPHRLKEWTNSFNEWLITLPYSNELIMYGFNKENN